VGWHGGAHELLPTLARKPIQRGQDALLVGEIADDPADWRRQLSHQRGDHDDVVPARQVRLDQEVDHFDAVAAGEVAFAQALQIGEGGKRFRRC